MIAVTGASGKLGGLAVEGLLKVVPPSQLVALARSPEKLDRFRDQGVSIRRADYSKPDTLPAALAGVKKLLLISSSEVGQRLAQHTAVIEAAQAAGVELIVYTSLLKADSTASSLGPEHSGTEALLRDSGIAHTILRNGWYIENYTENLASALNHGALLGAAKEGRIAAATRDDFAAAAVAAITQDGHRGKVYELAGDSPFTMRELADAVSIWAGKPIAYRDLPRGEFEKVLAQAGLPPPIVEMLASSDEAIARGDLDSESRDLQELIGRSSETLADVLARTPKP